MKKKIINLAVSVEADTRLRCLASELNQPLGLILEQAIIAYQPDQNQDEPESAAWRESIEARLTALEASKKESAAIPAKGKAIPNFIPTKNKRLPDSEFDRLIHQQFIIQNGVIRNIPPALRKQGIAVSQKKMVEALKRIGLKG